MRRANLNDHPELPELRYRRMRQAPTATTKSRSMRAGGRDSRSNMKDGTGSPAAMPACTAPLRVNWLHLAAALIGIAATLVPGVGIADDVYLRAGIGFDRPAETRFMDKDCSSVSPAALYGCGTGGNGAPLRSLGDFGTVTGVEFGVGHILTRATRVEVLVEYRPRFAFDGRTNFLEPARRQSVSADLSSLSGMLAAYVDLPELGVYRTRFLGHKFVSCGGPE